MAIRGRQRKMEKGHRPAVNEGSTSRGPGECRWPPRGNTMVEEVYKPKIWVEPAVTLSKDGALNCVSPLPLPRQRSVQVLTPETRECDLTWK